MKLTTKTLGTVTVGNELDRGGEGAVYLLCGRPTWLLKKYDPDLDKSTPSATRMLLSQQKVLAYQTFSRLKFKDVRELHCLPVEYVELPGGAPGYLMERAKGQSLGAQPISSLLQLTLPQRMRAARALAQAIDYLHSSQVVHADIQPRNFFLENRDGRFDIQVLDIDGGGYFGPSSMGRNFSPSVPLPGKLYGAPELVLAGWDKVWNAPDPRWRKQPDLWSLAVLLYQILVDDRGPFPTMPSRPNIPGYAPYGRRDFASGEPWPRNWQRALMKQQGLTSSLIQNFEAVFGGNRRIDAGGLLRPSAATWRQRLDRALGTPRVRAAARAARATNSVAGAGSVPVPVANPTPPTQPARPQSSTGSSPASVRSRPASPIQRIAQQTTLPVPTTPTNKRHWGQSVVRGFVVIATIGALVRVVPGVAGWAPPRPSNGLTPQSPPTLVSRTSEVIVPTDDPIPPKWPTEVLATSVPIWRGDGQVVGGPEGRSDLWFTTLPDGQPVMFRLSYPNDCGLSAPDLLLLLVDYENQSHRSTGSGDCFQELIIPEAVGGPATLRVYNSLEGRRISYQVEAEGVDSLGQ